MAHPAVDHLKHAIMHLHKASAHATKAVELHEANDHNTAIHHTYLADHHQEMADAHFENAAKVHAQHESSVKV